MVVVQGGNHTKAAELLGEMTNRGMAPNTISYNSVIYACGRRGEWQLALDLLELMRKSGYAVRKIVQIGGRTLS